MACTNQSLIKLEIKASNEKLKEIISSFSIHLILNKNDEIMSNSNTIQNLNESAALVIKYVKNYERDGLFIIGFKNTVFLINQSLLASLQNNFFLINPDLPIYFLHDTKNFFNSNVNLQNKQFEIDEQNNEEIKEFNKHIIFQNPFKLFFNDKTCQALLSCITGYLIQDGYKKANCRPVFANFEI